MKPKPKVSVIVPLYNQGNFVRECLQSLQGQTMPDWEAWVVNDGSTDAGAEIAGSYAENDRRIRILAKPNGGISSARNHGLDHATGEFVQFLDADDILLPHKFASQLRQLEAAPRGSVSVCRSRYGSRDRIDLCPYESPPLGLNGATSLLEFIDGWDAGITVPCHCFLFPTEYFSVRGLRFDSRLPNHEDFECWVRLLQRKPSLFVLDEELVVYRLHSHSMTRDRERMRRGFLAALDLLLQNPELPRAAHRRLRVKKHRINRAYDRLQNSEANVLLARFPKLRITLGALRERVMSLLGR